MLLRRKSICVYDDKVNAEKCRVHRNGRVKCASIGVANFAQISKARL